MQLRAESCTAARRSGSCRGPETQAGTRRRRPRRCAWSLGGGGGPVERNSEAEPRLVKRQRAAREQLSSLAVSLDHFIEFLKLLEGTIGKTEVTQLRTYWKMTHIPWSALPLRHLAHFRLP